MNILCFLAELADELIESLDAAAARSEVALHRLLRRVETSLVAAIWRLRIQRLESHLDKLRVAACHRRANEILNADGECAASVELLDHVREVSLQAAAGRRRLEEELR